MKKFYNKALMYQYYYTGRWSMLIGLIVFLVLAYNEMQKNFIIVKQEIAFFQSNLIRKSEIHIYIVSWLILLAVYFSITGLNKRKSMEFLHSGPFSKEEIKRNALMSLVICLFIICICYMYIFLCVTFRKSDIIYIIPNYYKVFVTDIIRFLICGLAFISYIALMDMLFSNAVLEIIMIFLSPILLIISFKTIGNLYGIIMNKSLYEIFLYRKALNIGRGIYNYVIGNNLYLDCRKIEVIGTILIFTCIFFISSWKLNKSIKMNDVNKLFTSKASTVFFETLFASIFITGLFEITANLFVENLSEDFHGRFLIFLAMIAGVMICTCVFKNSIHKGIKKYL